MRATRRAESPTQVRGQVNALQEIFGELAIGLVAAIGVILLLLTANFQSLKLALMVLSTAPAVLAGSVLMLLITGTTLNLESFMGTIMAIGVAVANAILLVTFAEQNRLNGAPATEAARAAAVERLRPVLMTSLAMIAGMIPMALAFGAGGEETAPLGRAVIGGLACGHSGHAIRFAHDLWCCPSAGHPRNLARSIPKTPKAAGSRKPEVTQLRWLLFTLIPD